MAVAAGEAQATVTRRIPIGNSRAIYIGTLAFGAEYPTGGAVLGLNEEKSRHKLPEKLDALFCNPNGGFHAELIGTNKVKIYQTGEAAKPAAEVANKTSLAAVTAMPFMAIGIA